jgi:hypothetical protein
MYQSDIRYGQVMFDWWKGNWRVLSRVLYSSLFSTCALGGIPMCSCAKAARVLGQLGSLSVTHLMLGSLLP